MQHKKIEMNIRKILIITTSLAILTLLVFSSMLSYNAGKSYGVKNAEEIRIANTKTSINNKQKTKSVLVSQVKNTKMTNQIKSSGRVISRNNITITSEVQGRLIGNYTFKKGTEINKGDIIFSVNNTDLKLLIKAKMSQFMRLISSVLADIKIDFDTEYDKWYNFFNKIDLDKNIPDLPQMNSSKEKNYIISRLILAEYLSIKSEEERLKKYTVLAPFNGIVTNSYTDVGANVNPGTPVVDFIRKGDMEIELTVNTSEIKQINIGDKVVLRENKNLFSGQIIRKGRFVNPNTQSISVFANINTKTNTIYNGMYLDAKIITNSKDSVFKINRRAIFDKDKVFIVDKKNKLRINKINIVSYEDNYAIIRNLKENTLVVKEPLINTKAGSIVKAIIK